MGLIIDNFAGGGGASTGIEAALGRAVDYAINHDEQAIRMHEVNHPGTVHIRNNIWQIDPKDIIEQAARAQVAAGGSATRNVDLAWFSPDCKHFSKAKGGKPREKSIRDLAWVVVLWAKRVRPALILLENVEEFRTWGPLCAEGKPIPERKGETFDHWCRELRKLGYKIEFRELRACDYGAPTIRKRFFMVARCDGKPIVWPEPTHGKPDSAEVLASKRLPWRTAASIIDWSIPCPSIFERKKPLAEKTLRRIAHGIMKFVVNNPAPFIVPLTHHGSAGRSYSGEQPLPTVTGANRGEMALVSPYFARTAHGDVDKNGKRRGQPCHGPEEPFPTVTQSGDSALIVPHITKFRNGAIGHDAGEPLATVTANSFIKRPGGSAPLGLVEAALAPVLVGTAFKNTRASRAFAPEDPVRTMTAQPEYGVAVAQLIAAHVEQANGGPNNANLAGRAADDPLSTVATTGSQQRVVTSNLVKLRNNCTGQPVDEPMHTIATGGHMAEVRAFLVKYYGNEQDGHGLSNPLGTVTVNDRFGLVTVTIAGEEYVIVDIGMRMLSPRELFNAQGFPFWNRSYTIELWRGPTIRAVEDHDPAFESSTHARRVEPSSNGSRTNDQSEHVGVSALIDLGQRVLQLRSLASSSSAAQSAPASVCVPLSIEIASAAQMLAHSNSDADGPIHFERQNGSASTRVTHGDKPALQSGGATKPNADGVERFTVTAMRDSKSTTSQAGPHSPTFASIMRTLSCFVVDAIGSSTLAGTLTGNSSVELEVRHHYIIDRDSSGMPITKTAQVAKCGNSVPPPMSEALTRANMAEQIASGANCSEAA